jgi:hypothetical protein
MGCLLNMMIIDIPIQMIIIRRRAAAFTKDIPSAKPANGVCAAIAINIDNYYTNQSVTSTMYSDIYKYARMMIVMISSSAMRYGLLCCVLQWCQIHPIIIIFIR